MRFLIAGVSALALMTAAGCKEKAAEDTTSVAGAAGKSEEIVSSDMMAKFKAKDYGETDTVLGAMSLTGSGNDRVSFDSAATKGGITTLTNVNFEIESDEGDDLEFVASTLVLEGLHMTEAGSAFDRMTLKDVKPADIPEGTSFNIGEIVVFEPNDATAAFISRLISGEEMETYPSFKTMAFGRMALNDLSVTMDAAKMDEADEGSFTFTLDELSINDLVDTIAGGTLLEGFNMAFDIPQSETDTPFPMKGHFKIDKMAFSNLQAAFIDDVAETVASGEEPDEAAMQTLMASINSRYYDQSPIEQGFDNAIVSGFDIDVSGLTMKMDKAETIVKRNSEGAATKIISPKSTIVIGAGTEENSLGAMVGEQLGKLGYDSLTMTMGGDATYDPKSDVTRYEDFELSVKDAISIKFEGGFTNLTDFMKAMNQASATESEPDMSTLQNLGIKDFSLTLDDNSLLDRGFKMAAEMQGMEPAQLRAMATGMLGMATMQAGQTGVDPELISDTVSALSSFLESGGSLTLSMDPAETVTLGQFEDPSQITKGALGWSAKHTK